MEENKVQAAEVNSLSIFEDQDKFVAAQRIAIPLSKSTIIPADYRNNIPNVLVAMDMSNRIGFPIMMVMQNLYIVKGRPSWSSQFIIAAVNNSKRFAQSLKFKLEGKGDEMSCYAFTKDFDGEEVAGPLVTMVMAKAEGWINKDGSKWKTMPEVMIRYRAASFFGRLYCSDLLMGIYTDEENGGSSKDRIDVTEEVPDTFNTAKGKEEVPNTFVDVDFEESKQNEAPSFIEGDESNGTD